MSWPALGWASKQRPSRSADKIVLIALADRHNEENDLAWPSLAWLGDFCCLDRKTVIAALDRLEAAGYIADSGQRTGRTGQVKAYTLAINGPEITVPKTEPLNSPVFPKKQSQKRDTEPSTEPSTPDIANAISPPVLKLVEDEQATPALKPEHVVEAWNEMAGRLGLPVVKTLTSTRRRSLTARLREHPIDHWTEAIGAIERSPFLCGENDRGWRADFDFLLQPKSFAKLIEGSYDKSAA